MKALCKGCGLEIISGQLRRGDDWHAECSPLAKFEARPRRKRRTPRSEQDIKAPDGYLLGGLRKVLKDGTILFQRGYWGPCPAEWIGERVWVHEHSIARETSIRAASPGCSLWSEDSHRTNLILGPADKPDAKPGYRTAHAKAWSARKS
jgi:hypothetical protein